MNTESFVYYESVYKQAEILEKRLGIETAYRFQKAVIEFGLYGVLPEEDSDVWLYGFEQTITSIQKAIDRRNKSIENGKNGGRPKILLEESAVLAKKEELGTWKKVAEFYGIDEKTLKKNRDSWRTEEQEKRKNGKNLNVNVNVNDNVNNCCVALTGTTSGEAPTPPQDYPEGEGTIECPFIVDRGWLIENHNCLTSLSNGKFYNGKYYYKER